MFTRMAAETSLVTSNRRLHRIAAFTAVSVLFGITSTVSALATQHEAAPLAAPVAVVTNLTATQDTALTDSIARHLADAVVVRTTRTTHVAVATTSVAKRTATPAKAPAKARAKATSTVTTQRASVRTAAATQVASADARIISSYSDTPGSQKAIDSCKLVLWTHSPLWLAGHNWCGWQWMAYVPTGSTVKVLGGAAAGTYVVTGHLHLDRQSGALPSVSADLVLQTCIGSGTGLTLLRRV
jgi:hypothetical protein